MLVDSTRKYHELCKRQTSINCRTMDATKVTLSDSGESESDSGVDDEELLLAIQTFMVPTSPKPTPSDSLHE